MTTEATDRKLTPKQSAFVQEYLIDLNATQAAIRVGYSPKTAQEQSARLLSNVIVAQAIKSAMDKRAEKLEISADKVLREIARIAFADPTALMSWTHDTVTLKPSSDLSKSSRRVISEVSTTTNQHGTSVKLRMHNKVRALDLLAKHLGLYSDRLDIEAKGAFQVINEFPGIEG